MWEKGSPLRDQASRTVVPDIGSHAFVNEVHKTESGECACKEVAL